MAACHSRRFVLTGSIMMFQLFRLPPAGLSRAWSGALCLALALIAGQSGVAAAADKQLRIGTLVPKNSLYPVSYTHLTLPTKRIV